MQSFAEQMCKDQGHSKRWSKYFWIEMVRREIKTIKLAVWAPNDCCKNCCNSVNGQKVWARNGQKSSEANLVQRLLFRENIQERKPLLKERRIKNHFSCLNITHDSGRCGNTPMRFCVLQADGKSVWSLFKEERCHCQGLSEGED